MQSRANLDSPQHKPEGFGGRAAVHAHLRLRSCAISRAQRHPHKASGYCWAVKKSSFSKERAQKSPSPGLAPASAPLVRATSSLSRLGPLQAPLPPSPAIRVQPDSWTSSLVSPRRQWATPAFPCVFWKVKWQVPGRQFL